MNKMFQQLIKGHQEKKYNKPKYKIENLYVGSIVKLTKRDYISFGVWENYYDRCKDYAIFYSLDGYDFIHIKSGQKLTVLDYAIVGDYAVKKPISFYETHVAQLREFGDTEKTKLSKKFLDELETAQNQEWAKGPIPEHKLFGA